jgi:uncharacterized membrane protein YhaH (DUF805 family)
MNDIYHISQILLYILAVVLLNSTKNLIGKKWLLASVIITLVALSIVLIIGIIAQHSEDPTKIYQWYDVVTLLYAFGTTCFGFFLFVVWSNSRMKLDVKELLFSFNGRIPRSVFWILVCILFPLGAMIGWGPFTSKASGFPKLIIWIIYLCWIIPSIWISLAIYAKRWHDCSKSGWMTLILFIPVIGVFWFLGYLGFVRGTQGSNSYGDDPLHIQD